MTTSCSSWVPLEVSFSAKSSHGDAGDDTEVNQVIYVKRTGAASERKVSSGFHGEIKTPDTIPNEDKSIVWPPTMILQNIRLGWDKDEKKWRGMRREEICRSLRGLSSIHLRVKCLYDFKGQKGCALVIFPKTVEGHLEAEALDRRLDKMSRGRLEWAKVKPNSKNQHHSTTVSTGSNTTELICGEGERILYGYLATPGDMQRVDPYRKSVKWFTESLREKLGAPRHR